MGQLLRIHWRSHKLPLASKRSISLCFSSTQEVMNILISTLMWLKTLQASNNTT